MSEYEWDPDTIVIPLDDPHTSDHDTPEPAAPWSEYFHGVVSLPPNFSSASERLRYFRNSPIIPVSLIIPLNDLSTAIYNNIEAVRTAINECAPEMSAAYPGVESLKSFQTHWIWNRFNKHASLLSKPISVIFRVLRQYYQDIL